ncbi:hypothetical protein [Armatimonas rosea]|uniref:Uncharacterized protein n=1 Tax=Armatimonas rosea TaxID=685828 RepID=A0A7W9SSJ0_ARMRO|nr:hypothetical protein [Armatimonas rosea]MBB6052055.1 hypothetical protein [Armatimonas rosea]
MRRQLLAVLTVLLLAGVGRAQVSMPDVQILVAPGLGNWSVAVVYPKQVGHADTEARIKRLGTITGWKLEKPEYEDKRLDRDSVSSKDPNIRKGSQEVGPAPVMSSVSFQTSANLVDYTQGTLALEPFLRAFRDMNKVNVTYLIPGQFTYRGPRQFNDTKVEIALSAQEGAYTYQALLKDHKFDVLNLPTKEVARQESYRAAENTTAPGRKLLLGTGLVALLALGIAGIAYALAQRFLHR